MLNKYHGGYFRCLKIRAHENDEGRLTARENRLILIQTGKVLEEQRRYYFKLIVLNYLAISWSTRRGLSLKFSRNDLTLGCKVVNNDLLGLNLNEMNCESNLLCKWYMALDCSWLHGVRLHSNDWSKTLKCDIWIWNQLEKSRLCGNYFWLDKNIKEIHLWNCQPENLYRQRAQLEGSVEKAYIAFHDKKNYYPWTFNTLFYCCCWCCCSEHSSS